MDREIRRRWRLGILCAVAIGGLFLVNYLRPLAQAVPEFTAGGMETIVVVPLQVGRDSYGLAMVDTVGKRLWIYEVSSRAPRNRLKLLAARDFQYDQMLDDYNTGEPTPEQVKEILTKLRSHRQVPSSDEGKLEEMVELVR